MLAVEAPIFSFISLVLSSPENTILDWALPTFARQLNFHLAIFCLIYLLTRMMLLDPLNRNKRGDHQQQGSKHKTLHLHGTPFSCGGGGGEFFE